MQRHCSTALDFESFFAMLHGRLVASFRARGFQHCDAADLAQEVCLRLQQKIEAGAVPATEQDLERYAFGIARNLRTDAWSERRALAASEWKDGNCGADPSPDPLAVLLQLERIRCAPERGRAAEQIAENLLARIQSVSGKQLAMLLDERARENGLTCCTDRLLYLRQFVFKERMGVPRHELAAALVESRALSRAALDANNKRLRASMEAAFAEARETYLRQIEGDLATRSDLPQKGVHNRPELSYNELVPVQLHHRPR